MKDKIRENAKKYFEEELSGEPLYQDLVIDWLTEFAKQQLEDCNSQNITCAVCGSSNLFKFKLEHIKCRNCGETFERGC
jgi:DNA-directed RNA polymerase subunit RPC12/RpoP